MNSNELDKLYTVKKRERNNEKRIRINYSEILTKLRAGMASLPPESAEIIFVIGASATPPPPPANNQYQRQIFN